MITNCHKNIMGTISFDGKFPSMRKAQDFIVYPMQDSGVEIRIQSENRFGRVNLDTGEAVISDSKANYANDVWLTVCILKGTSRRFQIEQEELMVLRQWIKSTGAVETGSSVMKLDNTGAIFL